ncbi:tetratricopeptide repeat protein [Jannaschia sp. LMIT008]|uniref:tetratricopeptide repeat protein n=1 Tax=Jannaschia maritima TaxID=3032585 RepID=UPI002811CA12|nr:tetratricopeptide repeat protein [Jannaschia sp. LMIT008]
MPFRFLLIPALALALAACNSSEERAAEFFRSGLELREEGDLNRAAIEFRNVFRYDGEHRDARLNLAEILLEQGKVPEAYGQYLRLSEQYPDDLDIRTAMALIAIEARQWDEAERHGRMVVDGGVDTLDARVVGVGLDYRAAVAAEDAEAGAEAVARARAILEEAPDRIIPRQVVIADQVEGGDPAAALDDIDAAIAARPDAIDYQMLKLQILAQGGDDDATEAHLRAMFDRFPDNQEVQSTLIAWYVRNDDFDAAEAFLRELAGPDTGETAGHLAVIRLIEQARGRDAAMAEVARLAEANEGDVANSLFYRSLEASYRFDGGEAEDAIAALQAALETAEAARDPEAEDAAALGTEIRRVKGLLAQILLSRGDVVGARALVEEVLAEDSTDVVALRLRGAMLIEDDRPDEAIVDLRRALDQDPRQTDVLLLLAEAHGRNGNRELMGERLATAVQVSGAAPRESLRYVRYLLDDDRAAAARTVLADAREANPRNVDILVETARLALREDALGTVRSALADLERIADADPAAARAATSLRSALLLRSDRREEGLAMLAEQAGAAGEDARSVLAIVQARLAAGEIAEARTYLDDLRAQSPDSADLRLIDAALLAAEGDLEGSEATLRAILEDVPGAPEAVRLLYGQLNAQGRAEEASEVLATALKAQPDSRALRMMRAGELELAGELDAAIEVYDGLYESNSGDIVVANNLASLLTTHREDEASLERASAVAQRLRGTQVPAFQDTYGWIAHRRGDYGEALSYLEPAAEGLPSNPLVNFHLGMTYARLDRPDEARDRLERALELFGEAQVPQVAMARDTLAQLDAAPTEATDAVDGADGDAPAAD